MAVVRLYSGPDGQSHLQEVPEAFSAPGTPDADALQPAKGIIFRRSVGAAATASEWHTAPRRQYVISLQGAFEIEVADGSKRRFNPGDVLLAEDTSGQGHLTRSFGDRLTVFIPLA
ncbi:MAG: hypothetical protein EXR55_05635 [Dehalococcoidia bacterium]|nr:hypothetical protein [Dehalococcoidia bacterium]